MSRRKRTPPRPRQQADRRQVIGTTPDGRGLLVRDAGPPRVLFVLPNPACCSDPTLASAIATRNRATLEGRCPHCGQVELHAAVGTVALHHAPDCPATTENLLARLADAR